LLKMRVTSTLSLLPCILLISRKGSKSGCISFYSSS
jgi:hypothetical protein